MRTTDWAGSHTINQHLWFLWVSSVQSSLSFDMESTKTSRCLSKVWSDQLLVESYIPVGPTLAGLAVLISFFLVTLGKHSIFRVCFKLARFPLITSCCCWRAEPSRSHGKQGVIKRSLYQWKTKKQQQAKAQEENKTNEPLPLRYRGTPMNKDGPIVKRVRTHALSLFFFLLSATSSSPFCLFLGSLPGLFQWQK